MKLKTISWIRIENWALPGTPDLLGYAPSGSFFYLRIKIYKVQKSPDIPAPSCLPHET